MPDWTRIRSFLAVAEARSLAAAARASGISQPTPRSFFPVRCDDPLTYVELVRAGCGLGCILCAVGDPDPGLERCDVIPGQPSLPAWLTAAPQLRQSPRLRRACCALAAAFPA